MGIGFNIVYHKMVYKEDLSRLSKMDKERIKKAITSKLVVSPEIFGEPLRNSLKGYRKLRVGDYRIIFRIEHNLIKIFCIGHRSVVYSLIDNRI